MAALVCDLCGGKLVMGAGGIASCECCGMEYSTDRMREKVQEIKGVVRVDNSHMVDNYLEMAHAALEAGNHAEAESYCNKIIEIDPKNYKAWMLKGEAAAWQSTLQDSRVDEGAASFLKSIHNAPAEEKEAMTEHAKEQLLRLSAAMISLREERFAKWPDEEEASGFISDVNSILNTFGNFLEQADTDMPVAEVTAPIAISINQAVVQAWEEVIWPEYSGDPNDDDDRPGKHEWQTFIERVGYCTTLVERAIELCDEDDDEDIQRYENLIFMHKAAIESCSWDYNFTDWGRRWHQDWMLTDESKNYRRNLIRQYEAKIQEIKGALAAQEAAAKAEEARLAREEAQRRPQAYWAAHAEEKQALEAELQAARAQIGQINVTLNSQLAALDQELSAIGGTAEIAYLDAQIRTLNEEKKSLGIFKSKERKAVQDQIDLAEANKRSLQEQQRTARNQIEARKSAATAEAQRNAAQLQQKIAALSNELTRPR